MSWQRILELARQRGLPVIVSDIGGREPMAILPLAEYERLTDARESHQIQNSNISKLISEDIKIEPTAPIQGAEEDVEELSGLTLEERFYLEPVDETLD